MEPDGTLYGCKDVILPEVNSWPVFEKAIPLEDVYYLDQIYEQQLQDIITIKVELPKIMDLNSTLSAVMPIQTQL